jgi:CheY-like chemotaxis protein/HPt (histidine-containing phosphotransfer) domain-containing protein
MMPGMDGFAVAEHVRGSPALGSTVVVILSSAGPPEVGRCRAAGITLYLMKPAKQSELLDAITRVLVGAAPPQTRLRPLDILLAEDNVVNQKLAVTVLEKDGHRVTVAGNGRVALDLSARHRYDVILMDLQMPEMGGLEATAAVRAREAGTGHHQPIVAMTAHAMKGDAERCLAAGMDGYVSKPVQFAELARVIAVVVPGADPAGPETDTPAPPARPPAGTTPLLDRSAALRLMADDESLLREIAGLFVEDCPRQLEELGSAIERGDAAVARRVAHTIKGAVGNFGARGVAELANRIEALAKDGALAGVRELFPDLRDQLGCVTAELTVWAA